MRRIVIETTRTSLRLLSVEGTLAQPRVNTLNVEPLTHASPVSRLLAGVQLRTGELISVVPRDQVITRRFKFPSTDPDELAKMAELTGKNQLPFPPAQAVADFHVVAQEGGASHVELVASQREGVDRSLAMFREAHGEPTLIVPSSWGLLAWYLRFGQSPEVSEPALVLNVDEDHTDVILVRQGRLLFSRSLTQGLAEWQKGAEIIDLLLQELERSLASLSKELPGVELRSVILTGAGDLAEWRGLIEQRLGKPTTVREARGGLALPLVAGSVAVVLGAACADRAWLVNLLPPEVAATQAHAQRMWAVTLSGTLLLASLLLGAALLGVLIRRQERSMAGTVKTATQLEAVTTATERKLRSVEIVERALVSRRAAATLLAELFRLTPPTVLFETLVFDHARGELLLRGSAPTTRDVLEYIRALEGSSQWKRVELRYSARRSTSSEDRTDFELVLHGGSG